jgi:alginate O-acetyltransferase complex protein AlgI
LVFSSLIFLFVFLPAFLLFYYLLPDQWRAGVLLLGSLAFYAYGAWTTPWYIALLLACVVVNFLLAKKVVPGRPHRKGWLTLAVCYDLGWLIVFKYAPFFWRNGLALWGLATGQHITSTWQLLLPIGISFYTFQIISYVVDVYRGTVKAEDSVIRLGAYLCMFPQLIAGPIVQYSTVAKNLRARALTVENVENGLRTFVIGLGLKVLLANQIGSLWSGLATIGYDSISTGLAWMGAVAFSLQIYFDFYGYSLMALGLGQMLGFSLPENFRHPYLSLSMTEFWRRWHITLGAWFRDYVYIPLGGNRAGRGKTIRNLLIVWVLTGFWHGASWNFLLWGFLLFCVMLVEKWGLKRFWEAHPLLGHLNMMVLIPLSWMLFAITDFHQLGVFFTRLFPFGTSAAGAFAGDVLKYGRNYGVVLAVGLLFCTEWPKKLWQRIKTTPLGVLALLAVFWGSVYCLYKGLDDPFLYFRF